MRPEAVFGLDRNKDIDMVRRVREVIGDELELVVDTPGARNIWDLNTAIQRFRDLEPYRLRWIEQPYCPRTSTLTLGYATRPRRRSAPARTNGTSTAIAA